MDYKKQYVKKVKSKKKKYLKGVSKAKKDYEPDFKWGEALK